MGRSYMVRRTIEASPDIVWSLLTDGSGYPDWNPAVLSLTGEIAVGNTIELVSVVNSKRAFRLTVTRLDAPHTMVWADGLPLGLFRGVRTYTLTPHDAGTEFVMEEVFTGPLAPLITRMIPDMSESFELFADGVKAASEGRVPGTR
jgi:uncharacterized protein YndB with AHSA1/START domain